MLTDQLRCLVVVLVLDLLGFCAEKRADLLGNYFVPLERCPVAITSETNDCSFRVPSSGFSPAGAVPGTSAFSAASSPRTTWAWTAKMPNETGSICKRPPWSKDFEAGINLTAE